VTVFLDNLVGGVATALGYLLVFGLLSIVMWKVGPRLYGKLLNQMLQGLQGVNPSGRTALPEEAPCANCGGPIYKLYPRCPWCGALRQVES